MESNLLPIPADIIERCIGTANEIRELWSNFRAPPVTDDASAQDVGEMRGVVKKHSKDLDAIKKAALAPLREHEERVREYFAPLEALLRGALTEVDQRLTEYQRSLEEDRRRKQAELEAKAREQARIARERAEKEAEDARKKGDAVRAAEAAAKAAAVVAVPIAVVALPKAKVKNDVVTFRDNWIYTVVNFADLPDKYKVANEKMIGQIVRAEKDKCDIPGIKVENRPIPVSN